MLNAYFTQDDLAALAVPLHSSPCPLMTEKMVALHQAVIRRVHDNHLDLHALPSRAQLVGTHSAACRAPINGLAMPYLRSTEQARAIERMIGRDPRATIDVTRHPVIEVRVTAQHVAIELIVPPTAWWDQRNVVGKLTLPRHQMAFRQVIERLPAEVVFGFWDGVLLSDAHVSPRQLLRGNILSQYMGTFSEGYDWLRAGLWYAPDDTAVTMDSIVSTVTRAIVALYPLYTYMLWTSSNNFHSFYTRGENLAAPRGREM